MLAVHFDPSASDAERRERLYDGDIVILSPTPSSQKLVSLAQQMLEERLRAARSARRSTSTRPPRMWPQFSRR